MTQEGGGICQWGAAMADTAKRGDVKKIVLAYSGGLDTSVILRWLQETYRCEVVTFTADLGQGEELGCNSPYSTTSRR
jgi:tRNA(Ile)-lysidine synthase TilS/MesJ